LRGAAHPMPSSAFTSYPSKIASLRSAGHPSAGGRSSAGATLSEYIARVQAIPTLSREEEVDLACRVRDSNDRDAARRLIEANLRYVVAIALSHRRYGVRLADLVAEGNVGLVIALRRFDPSRGTRFVTYAAHWIRAYVLGHVIRAWSIVGVGAGPLRSKVFFRLRREKARILASTNDAAEATARLAERFGTTSEKILLLAQRLEARDVSLDAKVFDDGTATLVDTLAAGAPTQEEAYSGRERGAAVGAHVRKAMEKLDPRERFIVEVRIMADPREELSLAEIGRRLGVSRERARQLEARAKDKLRHELEGYASDFASEAA
jgi:RNA polymerase sigma-32 factor